MLPNLACFASSPRTGPYVLSILTPWDTCHLAPQQVHLKGAQRGNVGRRGVLIFAGLHL